TPGSRRSNALSIEGTVVSKREGAPEPVPPSTSRRKMPSDPELLPLSREARIEQKLILAERLLARLPRSDSHARLFHAAVLRRDEALLDALLVALGANTAP